MSFVDASLSCNFNRDANELRQLIRRHLIVMQMGQDSLFDATRIDHN